MRVRVYVETNFIIALAHGEHEASEAIIRAAQHGAIELSLPQICLDEALSANIKDRLRIESWVKPLSAEVREYGRARRLPASRAASNRLQTALIALERANRERYDRLRTLLASLVNVATLLPWSQPEAELEQELYRDPYDTLIAAAIAGANRAVSGRSPFLTADKHFSSGVLADVLAKNHVEIVPHPEALLDRLRREGIDLRGLR